MKKVKPSTKIPARKAAKKNSRDHKKAVDLVEVRKQITNIVGSEAAEMALAVVDEALKGQLAPVKYLFEVAGLYPVAGETAGAHPEEDSLARTLLRRLGLPEDPVIEPDEESAATFARTELRQNSGRQPTDPTPDVQTKQDAANPANANTSVAVCEPDTEDAEKNEDCVAPENNPVE